MTDLEALKARLRTFEGSDELGNGDFSVCTEAADAIERLEAETIALTTYRENLRDECREILAKVERLEADLAQRDAELAASQEVLGEQLAIRQRLEADNARLREALQFYANRPCNLEFGVVNKCPYDDGDHARAALEKPHADL